MILNIFANFSNVELNLLSAISLFLGASLFLSVILSKIKIPHISGYVIAGILIGPYALNWVSHEVLFSLKPITHVGLGFIAFMIGLEFHHSILKGTKLSIPFITIIQVLTTILAVGVGLTLVGISYKVAFVIGAIASATAPGPIILLIKRQKIKKSQVKNILLPVVALDDAMAVIAFAIISSIFLSTNSSTNIFQAINEIGISLIVGAVIGLVIGLASKLRKGYQEYLTYSLVAVFAGVAISIKFHTSLIITLMVAGAVFTNTINKQEFQMQENAIAKFVPPIFMLFYTIAGAELDLRVFSSVLIFIIVYVLARIAGKLFGSDLGCRLTKQPKIVRKNLGYAMMPQAGVAIGLAIGVNPIYHKIITPIILGSVVIFEIIGPILVERAFANECKYLDECKIRETDKTNVLEQDFAVGMSYGRTSDAHIVQESFIKLKKVRKK